MRRGSYLTPYTRAAVRSYVGLDQKVLGELAAGEYHWIHLLLECWR